MTVRFGVVCDCQYTDADDDTFRIVSPAGDWWHDSHRRYRSSLERLQRAVTYFNTQELDFVVHLGDLADRDEADFSVALPVIEQLSAPIYHVLGNHDYKASGRSRERACQNLGLKQSYYAFDQGDLRFVVLDSNRNSRIDLPESHIRERAEITAELARRRANGQQNAQTFNGAIDDEQKRWLKQELRQAQQANKPVVIFAHHPVFPPSMHTMLNDNEILALFDDVSPLAFLNGHNHTGAFGIRQKIPYITFPGMLESETDAYSVVSIDHTAIAIHGFGSHSSAMIDVSDVRSS